MALTGADILAFQDRKLEAVTVKEWGGEKVFIRTMGAIERAQYEATLIDHKDDALGDKMAIIKVKLVILCCCDEKGVRLFSDADYDQVADKSADAIDRLFDVINRVNLVTQSEVENEKGK